MKAPGLKWRERGSGRVPYWFPDEKSAREGYPVKSENLSACAYDENVLISRCQKLQTDLIAWQQGLKPIGFNGSFRSLFNLYQTDPESPLHGHEPDTIRIYSLYIGQLEEQIGDLHLEQTDGRDVKRWFALWRQGKKDHLSVALMKLAVLKAAVSFGIVCRKQGCADFKVMLGELQFESLKRRKQAPTAEQVIAARHAAHQAGAHSRAFLYALQFETTGRRFDFTGKWVPLSYRQPSAIIDRGKKWVGPMWSWIDQNLILNMTPTKTRDTTSVEVWFDLSLCPMVMEELAIETRAGPLIINEVTGLPYRETEFQEGWRADFKAAGIPREVWCRDLRAGGITEGAKAGAPRDDRRRVAGHSKEETTLGYERGAFGHAFGRVMQARTQFRNGSET